MAKRCNIYPGFDQKICTGDKDLIHFEDLPGVFCGGGLCLELTETLFMWLRTYVNHVVSVLS